MKPLDLTAYPLDPSFPRGYKLPQDTRIAYRAADRMAREKRLNDTELAAEYWRARNDYDAALYGFENSHQGSWPGRLLGERFDLAEDRLEIIERFATLPHYDAVPE